MDKSVTEEQYRANRARWHDPDSNVTMPFGDEMSVWIDLPDPKPNSELVDTRAALSKALVQRDAWTCLGFGAGVLLGFLL